MTLRGMTGWIGEMLSSILTCIGSHLSGNILKEGYGSI